MSLIRTFQIAGAYAMMTTVLIVITFSAKADDKVVIVMFPPWLTSTDVQERIAASGGRTIMYAPHIASRVAVADRTTAERLHALGAMLVLTSAPARICTSGGVAAQ